MSYLPYFVWTQAEGGRIAGLCTGMKTFLSRDDRRKSVDRLKEGFLKFVGKGPMYGLTFCCLEAANFGSILLQSYLWIQLFGHGSHRFGIDVISYVMADKTSMHQLPIPKPNPSYKFFPFVVKCQINTHGAGGDIQVKLYKIVYLQNLVIKFQFYRIMIYSVHCQQMPFMNKYFL